MYSLPQYLYGEKWRQTNLGRQGLGAAHSEDVLHFPKLYTLSGPLASGEKIAIHSIVLRIKAEEILEKDPEGQDDEL